MEWQTVGVIIALVGLIAAIAGPVSKLNGSITRLTILIEHAMQRLDKLEQEDKEIMKRSSETHQRLHTRIDVTEEALSIQDKTLENHEGRIARLEKE